MSKINKYEGAIYDARTLGKMRVLVLGVQHMFAMFGAAILVPILVTGFFKDACGETISEEYMIADHFECVDMDKNLIMTYGAKYVAAVYIPLILIVLIFA